jgi:DNA repair photolyase
VPLDDTGSRREVTLADLVGLLEGTGLDASHPHVQWTGTPDLGNGRVYCHARPTDAYLGCSPGLDLETRLLFKPDLPALLDAELSRPGYCPKPLVLGANTDPYQPLERTLKISRAVLEVLERFGHPVVIVTKSAMVLRDLDILRRLAARNLVTVVMSFTTLDASLARRIETRATAPMHRLAAMRALAQAGIPVGVLAAPMIPGVNDAEMERILERGAAHGATRAGYVLLRLPREIAGPFEEWLNRHFPERAAKVLALVRQTRAGQLQASRFGERQTGTNTDADLLANRFRLAISRLRTTEARASGPGLDCGQTHAPVEERQLELL